MSVSTRNLFATRHRRSLVAPATVLLALLAVASPVTSAQTDALRLPPPTFPDVRALWLAGRIDDAIAQLERTLPRDDADQPLDAIILRATLHDATAQQLEAERLWRLVIDRKIWMRMFARRALVKSLASRRKPSEAELILNELSQSDPLRHLDLALRVADAHRELGKPNEARRVYRQIVSRQPRSTSADAARLGIATTLESDGNIDAALAQLRDAKRLQHSAETFERAVEAERRIASATGRQLAPLTEADYRSLTRRLRNSSRYDATLELIAEWRSVHAPPDGDPRIEWEQIKTLYNRRSNDAAVTASQSFYSQFPDSALVPDVKLTEFRIAVRKADTERARHTGLELWEGRVPGVTTKHRWDTANLLAAYLVAVGDIEGGLDLYRGLFQAAESDNNRRAILWRAGVAALRNGQRGRAMTNLRALIDRSPTGELVPAGLYWLARAERETDPALATRRLEALTRRFPYHYYGERARRELIRLNGDVGLSAPAEPTVTFPNLVVSEASKIRAEYRAAMALARAGLIDDAAWYLNRLLADRQRDLGLALLTIRASAAAGDYARVARLLVNHFGRFLQEPASELPEDFWGLVYPRPFWRDVSAAGQRHGVDPMLLASLMRQESRFDPTARSPVGAIGLFQVMPYTAETLAESAGISDMIAGRVNEATLAQPAVNAMLGARLTSNLLNMFDSAIAPVAASYNAGEERVAVWWSAAQGWPEDFFVDTIPYTETRRFVREVLTNYWTYQRLYRDQ